MHVASFGVWTLGGGWASRHVFLEFDGLARMQHGQSATMCLTWKAIDLKRWIFEELFGSYLRIVQRATLVGYKRL